MFQYWWIVCLVLSAIQIYSYPFSIQQECKMEIEYNVVPIHTWKIISIKKQVCQPNFILVSSDARWPSESKDVSVMYHASWMKPNTWCVRESNLE